MSLFLRGRDLLSLDELGDGEIGDLLAFARELKTRADCGEVLDLLKGVLLYVFDPDRLAPAWNPLAVAMGQLGGQAQQVDPARINLNWNETFLDLFRQLDRTGHGLAMASIRPGEGHGFMADTASLMERPVLNLISDLAAPFQTLASLMALGERGGPELSGADVALCWAPPGLAFKPLSPLRSLARALIRLGANLRLACPVEYHPGEDFYAEMDSLVPGALEITDAAEAAVAGADFVFACNWGLEGDLGHGADAEGAAARHADWCFSAQQLAAAKEDVLLGGMLPQSRDREIEAALLDDPRSLHLDETTNLLHVAKSVLALTLDANRE